ncbi:MAG: type II toxin-antitoxin system HipA family toxin [Gammaproteobacteria bacterium]|nr:type II toxin-antitoxin system HipA family toxin [Gammaproteobacteria bacterium]
MADLSVLTVALYGEPIGTLTLLPGDQTLFTFDQGYIDNPDRPTLSLSLKDALGELITDIRPTRTRVPPFFSNQLPEGHMRDYLAKKAGVSPKREFFLLWALGRDLSGAITVIPAEGEQWPPKTESTEAVENISTERVLRFSLAGVQLKFSVVQAAAGGLTIPVEGVGGSWIVKLPSMKFEGVPENEFAMMELARAIGIDVPEVRLVPLREIAGMPDDVARLEGNALAVKRFDRTEDGGAVHIEDFAQVFGLNPEKKYERASYRNIAEVLWVETGEEGIAEFVRRLVFNVLIGNADMHLKNWSLIYPDRKTAALSPGYDFVSTIAYLPDDKMALTLGRSKKMSDLSLDQLAYLAAKARLPEKLVLDTAKETVERFLAAWDGGRFASDLGPKVVDPINDLLRRIVLARDASQARES